MSLPITVFSVGAGGSTGVLESATADTSGGGATLAATGAATGGAVSGEGLSDGATTALVSAAPSSAIAATTASASLTSAQLLPCTRRAPEAALPSPT